MIATRRTTPVLILALSLLLTAAAALAATGAGRWSGTIASVSGDDLALVGVSEHFRLAGSVTELVSGRVLSSTDLAPGSAVTLRIGSREADGRLRVDGAQVERKDALALEGEITSLAADGRSMEVLGVRVELDGHTAFAGAGRLVHSGADLRVGMMAKVTLTSTSVRSLQAAEVRIRSSNSRSTAGSCRGARRSRAKTRNSRAPSSRPPTRPGRSAVGPSPSTTRPSSSARRDSATSSRSVFTSIPTEIPWPTASARRTPPETSSSSGASSRRSAPPPGRSRAAWSTSTRRPSSPATRSSATSSRSTPTGRPTSR